VPEGDTLFRAANGLRQWLVGREITAVDARDVGLRHRAQELVGKTVDAVEARAKHLLITVGDRTVHSHMKMTGSWHVYAKGERWRKSRHAMRLVLEAGDRVAVCFSAPVVQVVPNEIVESLPGVRTLGPDVLKDFDPDVGAQRLQAIEPATPIGDALLDQTVVSGLGNIWRLEALWEQRVHPATPTGALTYEQLRALVETGSRLMGASAHGASMQRSVQAYGRAGQPCKRCGKGIVSRRMGKDNRTSYFCPNCQVLGTLP
jgi:endonuclease VIII